MPNATVRAKARTMPKPAPAEPPSKPPFETIESIRQRAVAESEEARALFGRAYCRWLRARAALDDPDVNGTEEEGATRQDEVDEAARALLVTPVFFDDMVWQKWEVLEHFVSADSIDGCATDNRAIMALGCIKADLVRLGIRNGRSAQ
jgi:hypothetical protein